MAWNFNAQKKAFRTADSFASLKEMARTDNPGRWNEDGTPTTGSAENGAIDNAVMIARDAFCRKLALATAAQSTGLSKMPSDKEGLKLRAEDADFKAAYETALGKAKARYKWDDEPRGTGGRGRGGRDIGDFLDGEDDLLE
jgi:hypothetical protein